MFHASVALMEHGAVSQAYRLSSNVFGPIRRPVLFLASGFLARNLIQRSG